MILNVLKNLKVRISNKSQTPRILSKEKIVLQKRLGFTYRVWLRAHFVIKSCSCELYNPYLWLLIISNLKSAFDRVLWLSSNQWSNHPGQYSDTRIGASGRISLEFKRMNTTETSRGCRLEILSPQRICLFTFL